MTFAMRLAASLSIAACAAPALAAPLTIAKSFQTVSDPAGNLLPKAIPGAEIDYSIRITNPNSVFSPVTGVAFVDAIPAGTMLRVSDLSLLIPGPIEFADGNLLGLLGSGLTYSYTSLRNAGDGLDFSNDGGLTYTYQPTATNNGCDPAVTHIKVRLSGTQVAAAPSTCASACASDSRQEADDAIPVNAFEAPALAGASNGHGRVCLVDLVQ